MTAYLLMEDLGARRWPANREYWIKLARAADAIANPNDQTFVEARRRSRERAGA